MRQTSLVASGYPHAVISVDLHDTGDNKQIQDFLHNAGVCHQVVPAQPEATLARLQQFAEEENLDLVGELIAGYGTLLPTALHSLAWACQRDPDKVLYLGEAWENDSGGITRVARLRLLDTEDWKLESFLYPQMLFVCPHNLNDWPEGKSIVEEAGQEWRWALVRSAKHAKRLNTLRRTLAICDTSCISMLDRYRALRAGVDAVHTEAELPRSRAWLGALKPVLRPVSRVLPERIRSKGKRVWQHLNEV